MEIVNGGSSQFNGLRLSRSITWSCEPYQSFATFSTRDERRKEALLFRKMYSVCGDNCTGDMEVVKTCIWPDAVNSWLDKSTRITWVAIHGVDSICVAIRSKDVECLEQELKERIGMHPFWNAIVSEVEDILGPNQNFNESNQKPFAIVSMLEANNKANDAGCKATAIKFLQEEMKSGAVFTFDKTVQTTLCAFRQLFRQKFKADELRVFGWRKDDIIGKELKQKREDPDIEDLLANMNRPNWA